MMRRLLVGIRAESDAEMEEAAYRWRSGRMADLGFADFHEALAVYQELDPTSVRIDAAPANSPRPRGESLEDARARLPLVMAERLEAKTPFARAVAGLGSPEEIADTHFALVALANRVLSADRVSPGDDEAVRKVLERVSATLDLAIEFLARGKAEREVAAVRGVPLQILHRLGFSLIGKVRRLAVALVRKNPFAVLRPSIDVFEAEDADILASLSRPRPFFPRILEEPPDPGERPFATLADLSAATSAVGRAAAAIELITGLGIRPSHLLPDAIEAMASKVSQQGGKSTIHIEAIDTGVLARTVLVTRLLGQPPAALSPLTSATISDFKQIFNSSSQLPEDTSVRVLSILSKSNRNEPLTGAHREVALRWVASLFPLGAVLGPSEPTTP